MENKTRQTIHKAGLLFDTTYLEHKSYYMSLHNSIPNLNFISPLEGRKALKAFKSRYPHLIKGVHSSRWFRYKSKEYQPSRTFIRLRGRITIELGDSYCEILHDGSKPGLIDEFTKLFYGFRERQKADPLEINLVVRGSDGLELKAVEVKRSKLDLDLYYEDDFKAVHKLIRKRLGRRDDKGIVLLHGLPGTGKTTYLRYLVSRLKKQILFLSPNIIGDLMDPAFIQLLIDNPSSVIIIEDAESVIMDRRLSSGSSVSNLLNISDGLLADVLNVQVICTFNSAVQAVDNALMRKGRLIARYEFGKLSMQKAQRLSDRLGHKIRAEGPMTVAEITNGDQPGFEDKRSQAIGFRSAVFSN